MDVDFINNYLALATNADRIQVRRQVVDNMYKAGYPINYIQQVSDHLISLMGYDTRRYKLRLPVLNNDVVYYNPSKKPLELFKGDNSSAVYKNVVEGYNPYYTAGQYRNTLRNRRGDSYQTTYNISQKKILMPSDVEYNEYGSVL